MLPASLQELANRIFEVFRAVFGTSVALIVVGVIVMIVILLLAIFQGV